MERLSAWRYAVGFLEDYIVATEKAQHSQSKEMDRVLKVNREVFCHRKGMLTDGRLSRIP